MARNTVIGRPDQADEGHTNRWRPGPGAGFTFIEMVMVCLMIAILAGIAVPVYQSQVLASKEAVLKSNLAIIRERLDQFKADRGVYPTLLDELVERGYFREIPEDPMMGEHQWEEIFEEFDPDQPEEELGIYDVSSLSAAIGRDGAPYNEW
jgi:general secretion pathway protein G